MKKLTNEINIAKIDISKWNEIKAKSLCKMKEINLILRNYEIKLLGNQQLIFKSIQSELENLFYDNSIIKQTAIFLFRWSFSNFQS